MITADSLKEIRFKNKLSQDELAEKLGVSKQYISCLERGVKNITHKFETKLEQLGLLPEEQEKTAPNQRPEWLKNLTENEELTLQKMLEQHKELISLFFGACTGEKQKIKLFCQYLAAKYGVTLDL